MLNFLFIVVGLIPLIYLRNPWHVIHTLLYLTIFIFIFQSIYPYFIMGSGYFIGCDILSWGLVLLSFWICGLMFIASSGVYRSGYYSSFFLFLVLFLLIMLMCTFLNTNFAFR